MQLTGRAALLTGGKRIGAAVADALAEGGADVALSFNHSRDEAERAADAIRARGRQAFIAPADLGDPSACDRLVRDAAAALGRLDILVHMASVYTKTPFDELTVDDWDRAMAVDLRGAFLCARAAVPHMRQQGGGRIVVFSDWTARGGRPTYTGYLPYYVAKAGAGALAEVLALELAPDGILVNAIAPGPIRSPVDLDDAASDAVTRATPLGRWGGDEEIAKAVRALVESDFTTGETIRVDGGRHLR
ncbi:MAG: SDR family NAD(P)-dependent oxidoreductase [Vicinamibacterales bacterium]|jgi:NAD(P)-dependent dehydrogenase (short-subunit alcohol dehydrogenase family)|nr:SDR family NAD(P)-dependent oxidoreductase [Vicinamibacterales bacterium]MDP6610558.1 SDR family NAD(P)-dependent oxidoreductase [Vicinamibacterales bacterium]|tara:strand:+ start:282 stop:1022 length:741 start_codon:yes stop_codon:yes gene_type:complete